MQHEPIFDAPDPRAPRGAPRPSALDWRAFDSVQRAQLRDLATNASQPNPFFEEWHLFPSLQALDSKGEVALFWVEDDAGRALGMLPMKRERVYYGRPLPHWRNWMHANCFLGAPLVRAGHEAEFWHALFAWLDTAATLPMFFHLAGMPLETALAVALDDCLTGAGRAGPRRRGRTVHVVERAMLASSLDPQTYLENALSTKRRKELRRQRRRLEECGSVTTEYLRDESGLQSWIAAFLALEAAGWKGENGTATADDPAKAAIFTQALHAAAEGGKLERRSLLLDGIPLAMLASFRTPPAAFSYKTAFDENYARFSPGVLLQLENLDTLSDPAIEWVDSCASEDHPMIDRMWRERRRIARYSIGIGGALRQTAFGALLALEGRAE